MNMDIETFDKLTKVEQQEYMDALNKRFQNALKKSIESHTKNLSQ